MKAVLFAASLVLIAHAQASRAQGISPFPDAIFPGMGTAPKVWGFEGYLPCKKGDLGGCLPPSCTPRNISPLDEVSCRGFEQSAKANCASYGGGVCFKL